MSNRLEWRQGGIGFDNDLDLLLNNCLQYWVRPNGLGTFNLYSMRRIVPMLEFPTLEEAKSYAEVCTRIEQ